MAIELTAEKLRELLSYDPGTGVFMWRKPRGLARSGCNAGVINQGYRMIYVLGRNHNASRLAWLYVYGEWPKHCIDHINGVRDDNRIANLRDVSRALNQQNQRRAHCTNSSGLLGAHRYRKKWQAKIYVNGQYLRVGVFDTPEEAHECYLKAKRELHPGGLI